MGWSALPNLRFCCGHSWANVLFNCLCIVLMAVAVGVVLLMLLEDSPLLDLPEDENVFTRFIPRFSYYGTQNETGRVFAKENRTNAILRQIS
ncbi:hypothetical protein SFRURICE_012386 [Spodoptera frugiperda]|nr:hypothetical protein SFRURICE_012386 [Spodoptera frugiperda]